VTQHGGRIDVSSVVEQGTTVTVVLPEDGDRAGEPTVTESVAAPTSTPRRRVLFVDDEPALGRLLFAMLAPTHDVTVLTSGLEAEALLLRAEVHFDAILCDLAMPDVSGVALFEQTCAARPELRERFVFMTGGVFTKEIVQRIEGAAMRRLEKPFSASAVVEVVEQVVAAAQRPQAR
jgi:DNA-binding NtrC family response regulator